MMAIIYHLCNLAASLLKMKNIYLITAPSHVHTIVEEGLKVDYFDYNQKIFY